MCESFFAALECELIDREQFATRPEARLALFEFIEGWYSLRRINHLIGWVPDFLYQLAG